LAKIVEKIGLEVVEKLAKIVEKIRRNSEENWQK